MRYQFRVFAENSGGRSDPGPLSEPIAVTHKRGVAIAPIFLRTVRDTTAIENEKVEFTVRLDGTPFPKISWYKDGFEIFSNRRQRISTDSDISTFIIHQAALSDEGEIKCSATNKAGHAVARATLTLQAPPAIRLPRQYEDGLLFELGEAVKLKVSVSGRPLPEVTWYHDGKTMEPSSRVDCSTTDKYAMVRVSTATREDRGEYHVRAVNALGEDFASILVTITDRPLPPGKVSVVMTLGRCVTLAWTIPYDDGGCKIGNYIVEYFRIGWNMWLKAATCRQLTTTIGDLIEGSEYKFRVKAENPYGISDPSEESDTIFIPDPKRGILEPAANWPEALLEERPERWQQEQKKSRPNSGDWLDEDAPISSPLALAHQVLRKVKMAPKRGWSEDSQGSPPRESSPAQAYPMPVPPRRKHKQSYSPQGKASPVLEEISQPKDKEQHTRWEKELSPRSNYDELHSSSEMMLVLLPDKGNKTTGERGRTNTLAAEDFENDAMVAPPMSLSAPELSCCEPFDIRELRLSASSSEIMHELALIRFNQEATEEEAESGLKKRYGIERRRSFERRSSLKKDNFSSSKENLPTPEQLLTKRKELLADLDSKKKKRLSDPIEELDERESRVEQFSERFLSLEREFKQYSTMTNMKLHEDEESDKISNYSEDEYFEEETYHPRSMVPKPAEEPVSPILQKAPMVTINEEQEPVKFESPKIKRKGMGKVSKLSPDRDERFWRGSPTPDKEIARSRRSQTPSPGKSPSPSPRQSRSPSPNIVINLATPTQEKPPSLPVTPKPILKVRDKSVDRLDSSQLSLNKKVRIEVPGERESSREPEKSPSKEVQKDAGIFVQEANDIGLIAGEVARNRRKRQPSPGRTAYVDHYSDIVREYGHGKKPPTKLYLSYDELKAAAEKSLQEEAEQLAASTSLAVVTKKRLKESTDKNLESNSENQIVNIPTNVMTLSPKSKLYLEYLLDLFLFLVACWLYFFKDVRLTIPVLMLLAYRQLNESVTKIKLPWKKKDN